MLYFEAKRSSEEEEEGLNRLSSFTCHKRDLKLVSLSRGTTTGTA